MSRHRTGDREVGKIWLMGYENWIKGRAIEGSVRGIGATDRPPNKIKTRSALVHFILISL